MKEFTRKIIHDLTLIFGLCLVAWGLIQWDTGEFSKETETVAEQPVLTTLDAPPGATITVHLSASESMELRVVKYDARKISLLNDTPYPLDTHVQALGKGREVTVTAPPTGSETQYAIFVIVPESSGSTESEVSYSVDYTLWTPNYVFLFFGFLILMNLLYGPILVGRLLREAGGLEPPVDPRGDFGDRAGMRGPGPAPSRAPAAMPGRGMLPGPGAGQRPPGPRGPPAPARAPPPMAPPPDDGLRQDEYDAGAGMPPPDEYAPPAQTRAPPPARAPPQQQQQRPATRIRCSACSTVIPVYTRERPARISCPNCGRSGVLR